MSSEGSSMFHSPYQFDDDMLSDIGQLFQSVYQNEKRLSSGGFNFSINHSPDSIMYSFYDLETLAINYTLTPITNSFIVQWDTAMRQARATYGYVEDQGVLRYMVQNSQPATCRYLSKREINVIIEELNAEEISVRALGSALFHLSMSDFEQQSSKTDTDNLEVFQGNTVLHEVWNVPSLRDRFTPVARVGCFS